MYRKVFLSAITALVLLSALFAVIAFGSRVAHAQPASSTTNVQVNQVFPGPFPTNKQNEPSLAQNPTNPMNLISGSNDEIGEPACTNTTPSSCPFVAGVQSSGFYASFNGGKTSPCHQLTGLSPFHRHRLGDPL